MSKKDLDLLNLLCERVGISTIGELEAFKNHTKAKDEETLIKRLALYVAAGMTFEEMHQSVTIHF